MLCGVFRGYGVNNIITALVGLAILSSPLGECVCCMRMVSNLNMFVCQPWDVDLARREGEWRVVRVLVRVGARMCVCVCVMVTAGRWKHW